MHPLKFYLEAADLSVSGFARIIGVSRQSLYRILAREQAPKPALARRIVEATDGAVSFEDLYAGAEAGSADVVDFADFRGRSDEALDIDLLSEVLRLVLFAAGDGGPKEDRDAFAAAAAEAVSNTYDALQQVTSCRGQARLVQALRPVLAEISKDFAALRPLPHDLEKTSDWAGGLYFQAQKQRAFPRR